MPAVPHFAFSRPVVLLPYQSRWPREFAALAQRLHSVVGDLLVEIHHIGSTAVPGLCAKDVLDLQLQIPSLADGKVLIQKLRAAGFRQGEEPIYDLFQGLPANSPELEKRYMREPLGERRVHLHIRQTGRFNARFPLLMRDYLRAHAPARDAYGEVKVRAAALFPRSIEGYLFLKEPVFRLLYYAADTWAKQGNWPSTGIGS